MRTLRGQSDPLAALQARLELAELRARLATEALEMLAARFARIPERRRPYFTPVQRFRILEIKNLLAWSAQQAARAFLVCPHTILNWEKAADPDGQNVGSTVRPVPPVRRAADVVRALAARMTALGSGGQDLVARILLELALMHYVCFRPHEGLKGATPAETFSELNPRAAGPSRRPAAGQVNGATPPFAIAHLDPSSDHFPVLIPAA